MTVIQAEHLTRRFNKLLAVDRASFAVEEGEIFGLLGPNGAGKTTMVSMLTTLLRPSGGSARVNGFDIVREGNEVRSSIGLVFQETILDEDLSAYDNLDFHARLYGMPREKKRERIDVLLRLVDLEDRRCSRVETFSGGMKRKLEVARGLLHFPKVLFLDEPTLGLDPKTRRTIWDYLRALTKKERITMIITTHYMEEADYLCDRVAIMNRGKIITVDSPENLKNSLGGDLIILRTDLFPDDFLHEVKGLEYVKEAKREQDELLIITEHGETKIENMVTLANSKGLQVQAITLHKPTLEDVFLYYTGEQLEEK